MDSIGTWVMVRVDSIYMSLNSFGLTDLRTILSFVTTRYTKMELRHSEVTKV
jgi:hypothetical protein